MQANVQWNHLNSSTYRLATDRHTHPKINGPRGSIFSPSARDGRRAEGQSLAGYRAASCGFTDSHLWSSESVDGNGGPSSSAPTTHHGGTRTHDPESNEPPILAATNDDTSTTEHLRHDHHHHEEPGKDRRLPKDLEKYLRPDQDRRRRLLPTTARHLSYPCPRAGGGIRSEVTRLRIGRGHRAIGVLPSLNEANIPSGWGEVGPEVISPTTGRGGHSIWLGRSRP